MGDWREYTERVRGANPVAEVVASYGGKLKPVGRYRLKCSSPLREDRDPSFMVYTDQESWHDFGTREGGDVFDLVQLKEGCNFVDAVKLLGERSGIPWDGKGGNGAAHDPELQDEIVRVTERRFVEKISTEAAEYYHLKLPDRVRKYLKDHYGFDDDIIERQRMGWADGKLLQHLRDRLGYVLKDVLKTGLFIRTQAGRIIEHHEARITFPYPRDGKFPYMISRRVDGLTPDTEYQKSKYKKTLVKSENHPYVSRHVRNDIFYGEDSAKKKSRHRIITEGVTDAITALMCGWSVISPVTVRFKKSETDRCIHLSANANIPVLINDHERPRLDKRSGKLVQPGLDGSCDTAKALFEAGLDARVGILPLPEGADKIDLNEFVRDNGSDALTKVVDDALPYPEFLVWRVPVDTRPVELDEALAPAYEAISSCPPVQREAYINAICKRFSLTHQTVADAVDEFVAVKAKGPAPEPATPPPAPASPPPSPPTTSSGSSGPPSSGGSLGHTIFGNVFEHPDGYYYRIERTKQGEFIEVEISNFVLIPKAFVRIDGRYTRICCDIKEVGGRIAARDVILREKTFSSIRDFRNEIQRHFIAAVWNGKDVNIGGVLEIIREANPVTREGVSQIGYVETPERGADGIKRMVPKWIGPDYVITKDGISTTSEIVYAAERDVPIKNSINMSGAEMSNAEIRDLAQRVIPKLFELNKPEVILPALGWFYASTVAPVVRATLGHFPTLYCWGTQGSGKSTFIRDVFWRLSGVHKEPLSCANTKFMMLVNMSSTSSVALVFDEYKKDLPVPNQQIVQRCVRSGYLGETEQRGRSDQSYVEYRMVAPMCIIGEMMPSDPAFLERVITISPMKHTLTVASRKIIQQLASERLELLAGHFVRFVLGRDIRADIDTAKALMRSKMLPKLKEPLPPRLADNLLVAVLGDYLHQEWCDAIGITVPKRPKMEDVFVAMVRNITSTDEGGGVKDGCDRFLEALSTYAHLRIIQEGTHYAVVDGKLCIHLDSCYDIYLKERRKANLPDDTNGTTALRRIMREKHETGGYITSLTKRVRFTANVDGRDAGTRQVRAIEIDMNLVPEHLSFDKFPVSENRSRGPGFRDFDGWN